jgi:hypothetical protein
VERLDDELDRGSSALLGDLRRMTHANMSEEIEFFVRALDADLITPSDFYGLSGSARPPRRPPDPAAPSALRQHLRERRLGVATTASARSRASSSAPVAAIRSHSASACEGPLSERQVERRELRLTFSGQDEGQCDRAVEQIRAARLARALDRARHVQHVVEHLEGQPDAPRERAQRLGERARAFHRRERAQPAGGLEQRRRLQLAAPQVALDGTCAA